MKYSFFACAFFLSISCGGKQSSGVSVNEAFRQVVSPDAQTLISVKLDKLKAADLYRRHEREFDLPQMNTLAERLGLDPRRDLSDILIVWDGKQLTLLAQGSFSAAQVEQKLMSDAGTARVPYKNFTLFDRNANAVAFPASGFAMGGNTAELRKALDRYAAHAGAVPEELQQRLAEVPADSQITVVSRGGVPSMNLPVRADIGSALSNITAYVTGTSFGLRLDAGSHLKAQLICNSDEGAQRVHDAMRGLIGLARLSTNDNELDLLRMWDAVSITKDGRVAKVQADLPGDLTEKLIVQLQKMRGAAAALPEMR